MATFQWGGFGQLMAKLGALVDPDANELMIEWRYIIVDDNREGVLWGTDKDGVPMVPVKYRPVAAPPKRPKRWSDRKEAQHMGRRGIFDGMGPVAAGFADNLTSAQYRELSGPPLAPRGPSSRVIKNLFTEHTPAPVNGVWEATGRWFDVVSKNGTPFLMAHFTGANVGRNHAVKLPVRDLRGVRPAGQAKARAAARKWAMKLLRGMAK